MNKQFWELAARVRNETGVEDPKNDDELLAKIVDAIQAINQYKSLADIEDAFISGGLSANISWLEELIVMADIKLKRAQN